jgi:hypothetical protein
MPILYDDKTKKIDIVKPGQGKGCAGIVSSSATAT